MINFTEDGKRFNYRVVGVALHNGRVLLHKNETEHFWSLPGGRGELLELPHTPAHLIHRD